MSYLKLYYEWAAKGELPCSGLCYSILNTGSPAMFVEFREVFGRNALNLYWATARMGEFNEFRQNLLLFMAAMNNEL